MHRSRKSLMHQVYALLSAALWSVPFDDGDSMNIFLCVERLCLLCDFINSRVADFKIDKSLREDEYNARTKTWVETDLSTFKQGMLS